MFPGAANDGILQGRAADGYFAVGHGVSPENFV